MQASPRAFRNTLITVLLLALIGGILYAYFLSIPAGVAAALIAAFLLEIGFYLTVGVESAREAFEERFRKRALALWMTFSGVAPYLLYAVPTGVFDWFSFLALLGLAALLSFWYVVLRPRPVVDLAFIALVAAVLLGNIFARVYATPAPRVPLAILGQLMWTRLAIRAVLSLANMPVRGFGFLPARKDWAAGLRNFVFFLPAGLLLGWALSFASYHPPAGEWWQNVLLGVGTFLGMLWVVALREEFFFRGLLQEWMAGWLRNERAALIGAAVLFGLVHLWFRSFPNWRFAVLATVAGLFYGRAYLEARSVRAAMITHALVNTAWRLLFS